MPPASLFDRAASLLSNFGGQVAISIAASAVAAAFLAVPEAFVFSAPAAVAPAASLPSPALDAVAGKYRQRHHDAVATASAVGEFGAAGLVTASALIMPMALDWGPPVGSAETPAHSEIAALAPAPVERQQARRALPPDRPKRPTRTDAPLAEAPPRLIQAELAAPAESLRPPATLLGRVLPGPATGVGAAASSLMGAVGAVGSWTISQATGLLPRW